MPWVALGTVLGGLSLWGLGWLAPWAAFFPGCAFKEVTGLACATCGLTRCAMALGQGRWAEAFHWHPVAAVAAALLPVVAVWDLRRASRGEGLPAFLASRGARWWLWGLLAATWAIQAIRGI